MIDEQALVAALRREYDAAESFYGNLRELQWAARDYYEGKPFGNEEDGQSQIVLPDVQETIDYMTQSVLRVMISSDRAAEFEATDEEDEDAADDATAAINYNFMRQQDGDRILHDMLVDGLLEKIGVIKSVATTKEVVTRHTVQLHEDASLHPLQLGMMDGEVERYDPEAGQADIKKATTKKTFIDVPIPGSEFRFSPKARDEDSSDYIAHVCRKSRSELVEMGFDREQVYALPAHAAPLDYRTDVSNTGFRDTESTPALEMVLLCEEYCRYDIDDDGIAERVKTFRVENEILKDAETGELSIETVEEQPFTVFCPFPRPHRLVGYSLAEKVMDIQLGRSTIARQLHDGMYNANRPRPVVNMSLADENTIDDLLNPIAGSPIRTKGAGAVEPYQTAFDVAKSVQVMEWWTGERESRTGITRLNQGLDADALNKTATGTAMMQASGQQMEEFVAHWLCSAMGRMFAKKYRLMRAEAEPFKIRVDGNYKTVDPSSWPEEINLVIRVGLGTGSKDRRIQHRMMLIPLMAEGFQMGMVTKENTFNMIDGLARDTGLGTGDDFWLDPSSPEAQQQQGQQNPAQMQAAMKAQLEQAKIQIQQGKAQSDAELGMQKLQSHHELTSQKHSMDYQAKQDKIQSDTQLGYTKADTEAQLELRRQALEADLAVHQTNVRAETAKHVAKARPGGSLDR